MPTSITFSMIMPGLAIGLGVWFAVYLANRLFLKFKRFIS